MAHLGLRSSSGLAACSSFTTPPVVVTRIHRRNRGPARVRATQPDQDTASATPQPGAGLKAVWYGAEIFGDLVGRGRQQQPSLSSTPTPGALSREDAVAAIREDYAENYFVSGDGAMSAYAPDCEFADPFVSFKGVQRFKKNVGNLGGMMRNVDLDMYDFQESGNEIVTKWRFNCILDLPWKPRMAAAGSTTHVLDPSTGLVVRHIEAWEIEPSAVIKQLLRPSAVVPSSGWETFMMSASAGDTLGIWLVLSPFVLKLSASLVGISLVARLFTEDGLGPVGGISFLVTLTCITTEVLKFARGMQGGVTGTGGRF